ncbi:restriction endonuclease subunit S [Enterococcus faecium]|nr:restriction endonuclease subunit S [Enterococcus faecium]EME3491268.1 restriction endonuclease subunit S [Enterococcus faecium]EME7129060.1 restriction endonuclease subunit S [Enterococcus faecium]
MSNNTQPEIRFPGFTEDWEQRKLGDFIDVKSGKDYKHLNSGSIPVYGTGGYMLSVDRALSDIDAIGIGRKGTIDKPYLLKAPFWTVDTLFYAVPKQNIDLQFSLSIFKKINWKKFDESTGVPSLSKTVINSVGASVPSYEEQQKIGSFFKQLDETIALHQRKLDLLKETKKGFLQKMFPKNGAKVPEIRFPGFTEDWEERRLQEVVDRYDNLRIPITASKRVAGNTPYYGANGIQGYVEGYTHDGEFILVAEDGANDLKNYPVQYVDGKVWVNNHAHVIQAKENLADNMFLMNAIRSINIEPFLVGGGRAKLNADVLMKLEVIIPLKSEQQKIGNFFKQLDDTITLHQRKLDLLKEMKKGFLQKMFV